MRPAASGTEGAAAQDAQPRPPSNRKFCNCIWDRSKWLSVRRDKRGWIEIGCRVCGKFIGYKPGRGK